jgi:hypothetical protein
MLEGGAYPRPVRAFLTSHSIDASPRPALGTYWPANPYFCIPIRSQVLQELAALTEALPSPEVCDHLHVFAGERVVLSGYDAFSDPFYVSGDVPEDALQRFCDDAGCRYQRT